MTPESAIWNVERVWSATTDDKTEQLGTLELSRFRGLVMLGPAGAGKTTEAERLANHERASGACVRACRLAEFADTSSQLAEHLRRMSKSADDKTAFYLDALDEAMMPARRCWLAIKHWLNDELRGTGASLRITCRSAVWPLPLTQVIREFAANRPVATALLQALSDDDILAAAASHAIDPVAFLRRIDSSGTRSLADQPLSLRMLMRLHQSRHGLPESLKDLFEQGLRLLASDPQDRREIDTHNPVSPHDLLHAAERLACHLILTGRETVHLTDEPTRGSVSLPELSAHVAPEELDAVRWSGLSDSASPASFRFAHRQFAEYLAGRRLARLPTHQAKAFLAGPDGWSHGVAGPLRETAAFTAMFNADVAAWIATRDPDVIGLSDVADPGLRRTATLALLDRFRHGELTSAQLRPGTLEFKGLRYPQAAADLRPLLTSQGEGRDDLLKCPIALTRACKLSALSHDLADIVLDSAAPMSARVAAAYALRDCGNPDARKRLKPLIAGLPEDAEDELKGAALRCTWPDHLSIPELLEALTPRRRPTLYGTYEAFLLELDRDEFAATGHLPVGLLWGRHQASDSAANSALHRIAMRIAQAALLHLDDPAVSRELPPLLTAWTRHRTSPLAWLPQDPFESHSLAERGDRAPLHTNPKARHRLIDLLAEVIENRHDLMTLEHYTPGLRADADFQWLLSRACEKRYALRVRQNYLHLAWLLRWQDSSQNVDAWLQVCDDEPVKSILGNQRSVDLASEEARELRQRWHMNNAPPPTAEARELDPPPRQRVLEALHEAETNTRDFPQLCHELTLAPTSIHYGFQRFLTAAPGWHEADSQVRNRIVETAKSYLSSADVVSESTRAVKPKSLCVDVMGAMWLLLECDVDWLRSRDDSWWGNWCWYIIRQVIPNLVDERNEPKQDILRLLNERSPTTVCREITALASGQDTEFAELLPSLLPLLMEVPNRELDESLCAALYARGIAGRNATAVAEFVLTRAPSLSIQACLDMLNRTPAVSDETPEHLAVALLNRRPNEAWQVLKRFLRSPPERGRRILGRIAHQWDTPFVNSLSTAQVGDLAEALLELFPPETNDGGGGVHSVTPDDSARTLRTQLISRLSDLVDPDAVTALRRLESRLSSRYAWLPLVRSDAERALRLSRWSPFSFGVVADVLGAAAARLIRSEDDAIDGIECALKSYEEALRRDGGESPEDLWNTAKGTTPTPKAEEHVSSKLCGAVRAYFRDFAIAADREVEIHRRKVASSSGGEPGSEVDIQVQVPARGTVSGDAIRVPIEVKLSSNGEARTAVRAQLAERYMPQLDASHGVYVVVWMSLPRPERLREHHRPKWVSIEAAREDLRQEAERVSKERGIQIRTIVVNGSLR